MGAISINLGALQEHHVRQQKNRSRYINDLITSLMNMELKDVSKMTIGNKAAMLLFHRDNLPPNLVEELVKFLEGSQ